MDPLFLNLEEVLGIHEDRIARYGGSSGVRDLVVLQSALGTVEVTFGGVFLHETLFEMAAVYLFHISKKHPFIDGNNRAALASALVFLELNDVSVHAPDEELIDLVLCVGIGDESKAGDQPEGARHCC